MSLLRERDPGRGHRLDAIMIAAIASVVVWAGLATIMVGVALAVSSLLARHVIHRSSLIAITIGLAVVIVGISLTPADSEPPATQVAEATAVASVSCVTAMQLAGNEAATTQASLEQTAYDCPTVEEWLDALRVHPEAMGLNERAEIGERDVQDMCRTSNANLRDSPMCQDAYALGVAEPLP